MTYQFEEIINFQGERGQMYTEPLVAYIKEMDEMEDQETRDRVLRGDYVGDWEIVDGKLYLIDLRPDIFLDNSYLTVQHIFPGSEGRVFAEWFTGTLNCVQGKRLKHLGPRAYERNIVIEIEKGIFKSERLLQSPVIDECTKQPIPAFLLKSNCQEPRECVIINEHLNTVMLPLNDEVLPDSAEVSENVDTPRDPLYDQAVALVLKCKMASIAPLRRCLNIDYYRAARLIQAMQRAGLVSTIPYWWKAD